MPRQTPEQTRKLVVFVGIVVAATAFIWAENRSQRDRSAGLSSGGNEVMKAALTRLSQSPEGSMTMSPGTQNERQMRHVNAPIVGPLDVLVIGQSDSDHWSQTFFKDDVRFYDGFISNSYLAYQYEVFDDLVQASGHIPKLVLIDIRSGMMMVNADDPAYDVPADDTIWWAGPLFRSGAPAALPWYSGIDSLLSLQQTELTYHETVAARFRARPTGDPKTLDKDTGAPFMVVPKDKASFGYRWLSDGSRVYPNEVNGITVPRGQMNVEEATGDRHLNPQRLKMVEVYLRMLVDRGATVIAYSPPLQPRVFDAVQTPKIRAVGVALQEVAARVGVDYCDLSEQAKAIGCGPNDFFDELHISRGCNRGIAKRLADGGAPKAGAKLRGMMAPALFGK